MFPFFDVLLLAATILEKKKAGAVRGHLTRAKNSCENIRPWRRRNFTILSVEFESEKTVSCMLLRGDISNTTRRHSPVGGFRMAPLSGYPTGYCYYLSWWPLPTGQLVALGRQLPRQKPPPAVNVRWCAVVVTTLSRLIARAQAGEKRRRRRRSYFSRQERKVV